jgi:hypothetical protein
MGVLELKDNDIKCYWNINYDKCSSINCKWRLACRELYLSRKTEKSDQFKKLIGDCELFD